MSPWGYVALFEAAIILVQFIYWSWMTHKLVDKLMSRSFAEYQAVKHPGKIEETPIDYEAEAENQKILDELNAAFAPRTNA